MLTEEYILGILLNEMSLMIDPHNYYILDLDTNEYLTIDNKYLKYDFGNTFIDYSFEYGINPFHDLKSMQYLFGVYLHKLEELDNTYFVGHYALQCDDKRNVVSAMRDDRVRIDSRPFYNMILCYLDLIMYQIAKLPVTIDLYELDNTDFSLYIPYKSIGSPISFF